MKKIFISTIAATLLGASLAATEIIATVNGVEITDEDLQAYLQQMPADARQSQNLTKEKLQEQLIQKELLTQYALQSGIEKDSKYKKMLSRLQRDLALEVWMNKEMDAIEISQSQIKEYYEANRDRFAQVASDQVRARHILVESESQAKEIITSLQKSTNLKDDFIKSAKENSSCPSSANGGDLGFFGKGDMVAAFEEAAFVLKKGEMTSQPVKTQFGYHIIFIEDRKSQYEVLKPMIEQNLKMPIFRKKLEEVTKLQREKAKITINEGGLYAK